MTELSNDQLKEALEHCASEPIHIPGSIQPYGVMIVLEQASMRVVQASDNSDVYLGKTANALIGEKLVDIVGQHKTDAIEHIVIERELQPIQSTLITMNDKSFDVVAHKSGDYIVIEFEVIEDEKFLSRDFFYDELRAFAVGLQSLNLTDDLYGYVTRSIHKITGFDRVKLYKFDSEYNGQVIGESRIDSMPSYLGLHFPASDIPAQARKLYMKSFIRQIPDINKDVVPLSPQMLPNKEPLDMSLSVLRSVSPVHLQYLRNMGVEASMSVTVMQNNHFWGMIVCHNATPYHVPYRIRMAAELMGHIFSAHLTSLEEVKNKDVSEQRKLLLERLSTALESKITIESLIESKQELALNALDAQGIILKSGNITHVYGKVPEPPLIETLISVLEKNYPNTIFHTNDIRTVIKDHPELDGLRSGILAVPISYAKKDIIIWLRDSIREQVKWAGNPEKPAEETKAGYRLSPRSSFGLWKETVQYRCKDWSHEDIALGKDLARLIIESERNKAEYASAAKSEFLANMSHELRTPMNAIIGIANILGRNESFDTRTKEFISTLQLSSNSLLSLVNDLLDISKLESESMLLEQIPFRLNSLIADVRSMMSVKADEKDLQLNTKVADVISNTEFLGDPLRLRQALVNIISNAIKFTDEGFISIIVKEAERDEQDRSIIQIDISDSGIGMSQAQVNKIFDKFVQADESISRRFGGTGLGLAITKNLIDLMQGKINVYSQEQMGSKFSISIPFLRNEDTNNSSSTISNFDEAKHAAENLPEEKQTVQGKHILLAEDYEGNILVATTILQSIGHKVTVVKNGQEAVDRLKQQAFDVVIMDVQMPVMDGFTATSHIRKEQEAGIIPPINIIGMTAHALAGDRKKCLDAGMDDYISKPFDVDMLIELIERYS